MIRRILTGPFGLKVLCAALVWRGMAERDVAYLVTLIVAVWGYRIIRGGLRERYIEPADEQAARNWEAVVWNNTRWSNGDESPEEGIARLSTPHLLGGKR